MPTEEIVSKPKKKSMAEELDLPTPPPPSSMPPGEGSNDGSCNAEIDESVYAGVPDTAPVLEKGISEFRVESFTEGVAAGTGEPYFNITLTCQSEPNVGRKIFDFIQWVKKEDADDAKNVNSPRNAAARAILKERLWKSRQMMGAAKFKPSGAVRFKDFLSTNPVVRVQHKTKPRQEKTGRTDPKTGKDIYEKTSELQAVVDKYLPIV